MPDQPDDITRLRAASYALEDLPETIAFPQRAGDEPREPLPVVEATVDEIAFAIVEAERESSAAYRRADASARDLAGSNARSDRRAHGNTRSHFCSYEEAHATACSYRGGNAGTHEKSSDCNALSFHGQ